MSAFINRLAMELEPQAWAALGVCDTLAYKNRRTSSLRKVRAILLEMRDAVTREMSDAMWEDFPLPGNGNEQAFQSGCSMKRAFQAAISSALKEGQ